MRRHGEAGPPDGLVEFVRVRSDGLLRSAWLLTGDAKRAEDLVQTVLADAWPRWPRIADGGQPEAYLRRALFTTYVSRWQWRWRGQIPRPPTEDPGYGDMAVGSADRDAVCRALARLTRRQRAIVVLRCVEDLSVARTAEILGCPASTVEAQQQKALRTVQADPHLELFAVWR
ncbi:SigE family RNA polymerase sigma factor [Micromonospora sp. NPDC049903]|uniref:SigE family RNA polymerase sigma factor n=1 Tax=Micromonospora sp. NPDC049903 TaxID=3364276 RepID=UPI0037A4D32C